MFSAESEEKTAFLPNDSLTFTFYVTFSNSIPNWATFVKEVFDSMFSLESDKMTALRPNDSVTFTFMSWKISDDIRQYVMIFNNTRQYLTISNII